MIIVTFLLLRFALFRKVMLIADQFGETRVTYYVTSFVSVTRTRAVDYLICEINFHIYYMLQQYREGTAKKIPKSVHPRGHGFIQRRSMINVT